MHLRTLTLVAVGLTVGIGLVSGIGWAGYLLGATLAVTLWLIVFCGTLAGPKDRSSERVPARTYAVAATFAVLLGAVVFWITGTPSFWAVAVIVAGVLAPWSDRAPRDPAPS